MFLDRRTFSNNLFLLCFAIMALIILLSIRDMTAPLGLCSKVYRVAKVQAVDSFKPEEDVRGACLIKPLQDFQALTDLITTVTYKCSVLKKFGGNDRRNKNKKDYKWVCLDPESYLKDDNCIVYSFGIGDNWSPNYTFIRHGCKVYVFDPTVGRNNYTRWNSLFFYSLGIWDYTGIAKLKKSYVQVARLEDIRNNLGHRKNMIYYLAIDINGNELRMLKDLWETSHQTLRQHIVQIGIIIHLDTQRLGMYWIRLKQLECLGFRLVHYEKYEEVTSQLRLYNETFSSDYELLFVNENYVSLPR